MILVFSYGNCGVLAKFGVKLVCLSSIGFSHVC